MSEGDRGRRRRHPRGKRGRNKYDGPQGDYRERKEHEEQKEEPPRPIILAKPDRPPSQSAIEPGENPSASESASDTSTATTATTSTPSKTPVFTLKTRESSPSRNQANAIPTILAGEGLPSSMYVAQRPSDTKPQGHSPPNIAPNPQMSEPVKIVDDNFNWSNAGMEVLLDQTDYFVIGVVGLQGCGKSTIMSLLASAESHRKEYKFAPETYDDLEMCTHHTEGIDMYITQERIILLDTQPVMSASVLDRIIHVDKKPTDFASAENYAHIKSLQLASFLMAVCNVVLVCMDWFADIDLLKFIRTAEMLKPATPNSSSSSSSNPDTNVDDDLEEYYPHTDTSQDCKESKEQNENIERQSPGKEKERPKDRDNLEVYYPTTVFVLNRAERADFTIDSYNSMQKYLHSIYDKSSLKVSGHVNMSEVLPSLASDSGKDAINLFVVPDTQPKKKLELGFGPLPSFRGHPSAEELMATLRKQLFSLPRTPLTHSTLSEKNWFHYAARTWEAVKKSTLISEYNRLLNA